MAQFPFAHALGMTRRSRDGALETETAIENLSTATFTVAGGGKKIPVIYGPKYDVAVIYAPPGREFICFEPMSCVTNAFNLAHAGKFQGLQSIPPGRIWKESFRIRPEGAPGSWN